MKMRLLFISTLILLMSCNNQDDGLFQVHIALNGNPGRQAVYLDQIELSGVAPRTLDTAVVEGGNVTIKLKAPARTQQSIYRIRFEQEERFILLVNDRKRIDFSADWKEFGAYKTNSAASQSMKSLLNGFNQRLMSIDSARQIVVQLRQTPGQDSAGQAAENVFNGIVNQTEQFLLQYADTTQNPSVAIYAVGLGKRQFSLEELKPVMENLARRFKDHQEVAQVTSDFMNFLNASQGGIKQGQAAPEISLPDPDGKIVTLSSFKGKYVLVDFWASWCMPCRQENPNVVEAYQKFKDRNFTVLGVSLDKNKESWQQAIADDRLTWTQVSDLKFWNSVVVTPYRIEGIPFNVLVDPQGNIIASNLRGPNLTRKLSELFP